jgi:glutamine synthetase
VSTRFLAVEATAQRHGVYPTNEKNEKAISESFGINVFSRSVMQQMLPQNIFRNILNAMDGKEKIKEEYADSIAVAMKEWAMTHGATHFSHWFQPLTGASAEKHDAFIDWTSNDEMIEKFTGKQLVQGEPDASSFPSGGLRTTYEARGYTGWDPTSPVFIWKSGGGTTLCIPSVFFSWTGDVLDNKIPLLRSEKKIGEAVLRLLKLTGVHAEQIRTTLGLEQEYFVIDRALANLRPDILMAGKTVFGASAPKGQELQDHYFGSVKERIISFMHDFETEALKLGIPVKTRHNEVAPAQHEVAPSVEKASAAIDHNILLMELMRMIAVHHDLKVLLHEKPFAAINGSGKHCNWSLSTDTGINLLHPTEAPGNNFHFLILLTAILEAFHTNSELLRASIGSANNDYRLGGHEAPPAIMSVYLGQALERLLDQIEKNGVSDELHGKGKHNLGILELPEVDKDNTDRNRTSPFAFTGNKFEFRALGSSANPAFTVAVLNAVVAHSLNKMLDEIEKHLDKKKLNNENLIKAATPVIQKYLKSSKAVRFSGDNYSQDWIDEAKKRKLPNIKRSVDSFPAIIAPKTIQAFKGILTEQELKSRYEVMLDHYSHTIHIEIKIMIDMFKTQILPAALRYQEAVALSIQTVKTALNGKNQTPRQDAMLKNLTQSIEEAIALSDELDKLRGRIAGLPVFERAKAFSDELVSKAEHFRGVVDALEILVDDELWPLPKYRELLFMI